MIKNLRRSDITVRPFNTFKRWRFGNIDPEDVLMTEDGCPIFTSYISSSSPLLCADPDFSSSAISPEQQQVQFDFKIVEGEKIVGHFYESGSDEYNFSDNPTNRIDGSYKRLIFNSIKSSFYNEFNNPEYLFGVESVDRDPRGKKREIRNIQKRIRVGQLSSQTFGHKIQPGTVKIKDQSNPDETYTLVDDGYTNLLLDDVFFKAEIDLAMDSEDPKIYPTSSYTPTNDRFGTSVSAFKDYIAVGGPDDELSLTHPKSGFANIIKFDISSNRFRPLKTFYSPWSQNAVSFEFARDGSWLMELEQGGYLITGNEPSPYTSQNDGFGNSVSITDEFFAVGAPNFECYSGSRAGTVFVFDKNKGGIDHWGVINALESEIKDDMFGYAVKLNGDDLFVGAPGDENNAGAVYHYKRKVYNHETDPCINIPTASFYQLITPHLSFFYPDTSSHCAVAVLGGESGSFTTEFIGMPTWVSGSNTFILQGKLQASDKISNSYFGGALDAYGDTLVVGNSKPEGLGRGKVYTFTFVSSSVVISGSTCITGSWVQSCNMDRTFNVDVTPPYDPYISQNEDDSYGHSVALDGAYLLIGSPTNARIAGPTGSVNMGGVYMYKKSDDGTIDDCFCNNIPTASTIASLTECDWGFDRRFDFSDSFRDNWFGTDVDIFENRFVVGCPIEKRYIDVTYDGNQYSIEDYEFETDSGKMFVYKLDENIEWQLEKEFTKKALEDRAKQDFGISTVLTNRYLYVGSPARIQEDSASKASYDPEYSKLTNLQEKFPQNVSGSVYVYDVNDLNNRFQVGNVFYRNGLVVITDTGSFFGNILSGSGKRGHEISFQGEHAIYENEFLIPIKPGEFNVSTNPTSLVNEPVPLDVNENGIYDSEDLDLILRYLNKFKFLSEDQISSDTGYVLEQTEAWWNNDIIMTEAENALVLNGFDTDLLQEQFEADGNKLDAKTYAKLVELDEAGLLDFDGDGKTNTFDGKILINYTANIRNQTLIEGLINDNSIRNTPSLVTDHLDILTGAFNLVNTLPEFHNYVESSSFDRTGSYLSPMATSIGLYNEEYQLVAVAKLGRPAKILQNAPLNFIVRIDF
jgi:hypothetical protein